MVRADRPASAHPTGVIEVVVGRLHGPSQGPTRRGIRCRILGCSYCVNVSPAAWWETKLVWWVPLLALVGLTVAVWGGRHRETRAAALVAACAFLVLVPAAVIVAFTGHTDLRLEAAEAGVGPIDGDHWRVRCEAPFLGPRNGNELGHAAWDACNTATAPARYTVFGLVGAAAAMAAVGFALLVSRGRRDGPDPEVRERSVSPLSE